MNRIATVYLAIIVLLLVVSSVLAYLLFVPGHTQPGTDGRVAIVLDPGERAAVLGEMRGFLAGTRDIILAANAKDMAAVAKTARPLGMAAAQQVPAGLMTKLPLGFRQLGHSVHADFDRLALDAESFGDPKLVLEQLTAILGKCVGCHASFQLAPAR